MKIIERIIGLFKNSKEKQFQDRIANILAHPQNTTPDPNNVPGDFYVQCDSCIHCGAPEAEAPDLMDMTETGCYFKKQPETKEETERAINALSVSCISAVRYRGTCVITPKIVRFKSRKITFDEASLSLNLPSLFPNKIKCQHDVYCGLIF